MRKFLVIIAAIVMIAGLSTFAYASPASVTVDSDANGCTEYNLCDTGYSPVSIFFEAGVYNFTVDSGSFLSGNEPHVGAVWPMKYFWGLNIYQPDTSTEYVLGDYAPYDTGAGALSANIGASVQVSQATAGNLLFYVRDDVPRDNEGLITANVAVVPEPVSSILFLSGGAALAGRRFWKKKK